jgi:hypothetical protein
MAAKPGRQRRQVIIEKLAVHVFREIGKFLLEKLDISSGTNYDKKQIKFLAYRAYFEQILSIVQRLYGCPALLTL